MQNPEASGALEPPDFSHPPLDDMTMNHIENMLRSLVPTSPSPELYERVAHDFALAAKFRDADILPLGNVAHPRKPLFQPLTWATFGAAAAVVIMSTMQYAHYHTRSGGESLVETQKTAPHLTTEIPEITSSREFVKVNDDGINFSQAGQAQRQLRVKSIERRQWVDPRDGAVYIIETPREHAIVVPVNVQ
jgi:hypothetical protein